MFQDFTLSTFLSIIGIDLLLSGDNALVIAMVCEELPEKQKRFGIFLGSMSAVLARLLFLTIGSFLLGIPGLHVLGGLFLFWVAWGLYKGSEESTHEPKSTLWGAVITIAVADVMMSLDNVIAVLGAAHGNLPITVVGVLISLPIVFFGATVLEYFLEKYPFLIKLGVLLIIYVAFETVLDEPVIRTFIEQNK